MDLLHCKCVFVYRDALYVSEDYVAGYGEAEGAARRPRTKIDVIGAWRGLAREALGDDHGCKFKAV